MILLSITRRQILHCDTRTAYIRLQCSVTGSVPRASIVPPHRKESIMAQIARTKDPKAAEAARTTAARAIDTAGDMAEQGRDKTLRVVEKTAATAEAMADGSRDAAQRLAALSTQAASKTLQTEVQPARFWLELANEQTARNLAFMSKLATTRDWREALAIQQAFARDSFARMNEGMSRSMILGGKSMARLLTASRGETDRVA
jgi:hypothetical protein